MKILDIVSSIFLEDKIDTSNKSLKIFYNMDIHIKNPNTVGGDDYGMLREVLTRRFKRLQDEPNNKPDLVLIDGGAGQLGIATQVFEELGINDIIYVGIAKGEDRNAGREYFFMQGREAFQLPENNIFIYGANAAGFVPINSFVPTVTVSGRSVLSLRVIHGTPRTVVSSVMPPLSVITHFALSTR